jgi:hypothetical protein
VLPEFPEVRVEKVCVDEDPEPMRALGLRRYPALASGQKTLSAIFLTKRKIRGFLKKL